MKNTQLLFGFCLMGIGLYAQQAPTNFNPLPAAQSGSNDKAFWSRAGNSQISGNNNIFGTLWNSPIYTQTNSANRTKLNGDVNYTVNGFNAPRNGYFLLGINSGVSSDGTFIYATRGAFSQFHIHGTGVVQEFGYRPWMKTGITLTDNSDMSYFGLRQVGTGIDVTETVINWTDNVASPPYGPDDMVFRFSTDGSGNPPIDPNNLRTSADLDGLHVARFAASGLFSLGNTFGVNAAGTPIGLYARPQSLFHMSYDWQAGIANDPFGFMQVTYRRPTGQATDIIGQGEQVTDGLRFGINNIIEGVGTFQHLNGYLRWQEQSSFIVQTEDDATPNIQQNERLRVTSIGALGANWGTAYIGMTAPTNVSRLAVSYDGATPLTRPMSLLHLGYNIGGVVGTTQIQNGWRPWMDLGMLVSNSTDNVWIGLKPRAFPVSANNNQMDAVVSWGNDGVTSPGAGPDVMRFIFTAEPFSNLDSSVAVSPDGLEVARLYPGKDTVFTNGTKTYGRMGVGDFTAAGVNQQPTHKLDVVGNGRFRYLPDDIYEADATVTKVVMVDQNGVLRWSDHPSSGFGAACNDSVDGQLQFDTKIDLNNHNLYFTRIDSTGANQVGIGYDCGTPMEGKISVFSNDEVYSGHYHVDGSIPTDPSFQGGVKSEIEALNASNSIAVWGTSGPNVNGTMTSQVGVQGEIKALDAKEAVGVKGISIVGVPNSGAIGGRFLSNGSAVGRAVQAQNTTTQLNGPTTGFGFGGDFNAQSGAGQSVNSNTGVVGSANGVSQLNTGVRGLASGSSVQNLGVFGQATGGTQNWAGYFVGDVYISGTYGPSDQLLKENVAALEHADSIIELLNPVTFDFKTTDYPQLSLPEGNQMGLIAQQVEQVLPNIVNENTSPAQYDSLGNVVAASVTFKTVDYTKMIPLLIAGHQQQEAIIEVQAEELAANHVMIDSLTTVVDDLSNRLTQLENCLSGILPYLCQLSQSAVETNDPAVQDHIRAQLSVKLTNRDAIILDQNVPNPFAEQTVINFSIPESVQKAQIHFYNGEGRLMQSVDVVERGAGGLTVFGSDLSSGVYTYTLVADGQIVATKKMVKQ